MTNEELVKKIRNGISVTDNMQMLYENNLSILKRIIKPYSVYESTEDLLQEAYLGLVEAVKHYETSENVLFMTYAGYWIKQVVIRYIENSGSVIRIPSYMREKIIRYKKCVEKLSQKLGRLPTDDEIVKAMDISKSELDKMKIHLHGISSLDAPLNNDTDDTLGSTVKADFSLENETIDKIYDDYAKNELWAIVEDYTTKQENEIIRNRYINEETLQVIADRNGLSRDRVRQIEASALRKLGSGKAKRKLQERLDIVDCGMYRNGVAKFNEHGFTSTVEYIAMRRMEIEEEYEKRLEEIRNLSIHQNKCV